MRRRLEPLAFASAAALPFVPYFAKLATEHVPRFSVVGDQAGIEAATRLVWTGKVLLGPYSRFGFSHPGPLYFFFLWPWYELSGRSSIGLSLGAAAVNALSAMATVAILRIFAGRAQALAALVVLFAWMAAFGNVTAICWNPAVIVLPLVAFLVSSAVFARGESRAAPLVIVFGAFVAETHLSTVPTVCGVALFALVSFFVFARRAGGVPERARLHLGAMAALAAVAASPMIVEQLSPSGGNLGKIAAFFVHRPEPMKSLEEATTDWAYGASWMLDRAAISILREEGGLASVLYSDPTPAHVTRTATHLAALLLVGVVVAGVIAIRRRRWMSVSVLAVASVAMVLSLFALRAIIGPRCMYLVFWTTAATTVAWMGVVGTVFEEIAAHARRIGRSAPRFAFGLAAALTLAVAWQTVGLQRDWLRRNRVSESVRADAEQFHQLVRARLARDGATPVVHNSGAWWLSFSTLLELLKDGFEPRIVARDRWILGRYFDGPEGAPRPLHLYSTVPSYGLPARSCLELVGKVGDAELYVSPDDIDTCPPPQVPR